MQTLRIDVWSDIACPWCYVGKRRLEAALAEFPHRDAVALVWRAFELDPSAPRDLGATPPYAARLARKYGSSVAEAQQMIERMTATAAVDGLDFHFERIRPGNTFDAHRLLHLAHERGLQDALKERLFRAYLGDGEPIGDPATLVRLAGEVGLDTGEAAAVLAGDAYAREVRADEEEGAGSEFAACRSSCLRGATRSPVRILPRRCSRRSRARGRTYRGRRMRSRARRVALTAAPEPLIRRSCLTCGRTRAEVVVDVTEALAQRAHALCDPALGHRLPAAHHQPRRRVGAGPRARRNVHRDERRSRSVPIVDIRSRFDCGEDVEVLAQDYQVPVQAVQEALRASGKAA